MNHDLILDRDAFALWESGGLSAHLDLDGRLGAQRGDTLTMHKQRVGPFGSDREKNAPRPDPLTFEVTYVSRTEGCTYHSGIAHDSEGPFHSVPIGWRHRMVDAGECQAVLWLEQDPGVTPELAADGTDLFEIGRFGIRPVWTGDGVEWQRVTG